MSMKRRKDKTLSEKVSESFIPRPLLDPENDIEDETTAKFTEFVEENSDVDDDYNFTNRNKQLSDIRKRNIKILSEYSDKYKGKVSSRHELEESDDDEENDDDEEENDNNEEDNDEDDVEDEDGKTNKGSSLIPKYKKPNFNDNDNNKSDIDEDSDDDNDLEQYRKKLKNCQLESEPDEFLGTDDDDEDNNNDDDDEGNEEEIDSENDDELHEEGSNENDYEDSDYDSPGENISDSETESGTGAEEREEFGNNSELLKETDDNENIKKGLAVQNQLKMWEKLLEIRIHSQKMLYKANSLPNPNQYQNFYSKSDEFKNVAKETERNVMNLLDKMYEMQTHLFDQFSETKELLKCGKKRQYSMQSINKAEDEEDGKPPTKKYSILLENNFEKFRNYQNSVLQKWCDRTKILTPGSSKGSRTTDFDVVKKIETVLLNKNDLITKSQIVKGNYKLFAIKDENKLEQRMEIDVNDEENEEKSKEKDENILSREIYDDTDFYHQQLRELIEYKSNTANNPLEMAKQFAELQKLRQKMKKKVDTRASKGRKIRYVVHNKLVNFMAPYDNSEWTDESKTELYRSLFTT